MARRIIKWLGLTVAGALLVLTAVLIGLQVYFTDARLTALVREELKKNVPFAVQIGRAQLRFLHGLVIEGLVVGPPTPAYRENVLEVREIRVGYTLAPLIKKKLALRTLLVDAPRVTLEMQGGVWNLRALGDAFKKDAAPPAPAAAQGPAPADGSTAKLPVEIEIGELALRNVSLRVISPDIEAAIDRVYLSVGGSYRGDRGAGEVAINLGDDQGATRVHLKMGKNQLDTEARLALKVVAPSLTEAQVALDASFTSLVGRWAGRRLPGVPIGLQAAASASLLKQKVELERLSLSLGAALSLTVSARADEILGDPLIDVRNLSLGVDLGALMAMVPGDLVPRGLSAAGTVALESFHVRGRQSALVGRDLGELGLKLTLRDVRLGLGANELRGLDAALTLEGGDHLQLALASALEAAAVGEGARASGLSLRLKATAPGALLKNALPSPIEADVTFKARALTQGARAVEDLALDLSTQVFDLAAEHVSASLALEAGAVRAREEGFGALAASVALALDVERRGREVHVRKLALDVAKIVSLTLAGKVAQKAKGALEADVTASLQNLDLAKLLAWLPPELRAKAGVSDAKGVLAAKLAVKGVVPPDLGKRLAAPPLDVIEAGLPFNVDFSLHWSGLALATPRLKLSDVSGALSVHGQPRQTQVALETSAASITSGADTGIFGLKASIALGYAASRGQMRVRAAAAAIEQPSVLAMALKDNAFALDVDYLRGGALSVGDLTIKAPSLGAAVSLKGRLPRAAETLAARPWATPDMKGLEAELSGAAVIAVPAETRLTTTAPALGGMLGAALEVGVKEGLVRVAGKLSADRFSLRTEGTEVAGVSGTLPFTQELRFAGGALKPVLSADDTTRQKPHVAYYQALRSYGRDAAGLRIAKIQSGRYTLSEIVMNARLEKSMLVIDHLGVRLLNGDALLQCVAQLTATKELRLSLGAEFSNLDLSVLSNTPPGPDSQVGGNVSFNLLWGEQVREIDKTAFNLTRMGRTLLVKALLATDPEGKDEKRKKQREQIEAFKLRIDLVRVAINHNIIGVDFFYSFLLGDLTFGLYKPLPPKLISHSDHVDVAPYLEQYLAPSLDPPLGSLLEWSKQRRRTAGRAP